MNAPKSGLDTSSKAESLEERINSIEKNTPKRKVTLLLNSNDFEKIYPAFSLAVESAALDMDVTIFFSFWSISILRKKNIYSNCSLLQKAIKFVLPYGTDTLSLRKMNMFGMGTAMFKFLMKKKNFVSITQLFELAKELNVKMIACSSTMDIMGLQPEEMVDCAICGGITTYITEASESQITLLF